MKRLDKMILGFRGVKLDLNGERVTAEAIRQARLFVDDNIPNPTPSTYKFIETAVLIGVSVGLGEVGKSL